MLNNGLISDEKKTLDLLKDVEELIEKEIPQDDKEGNKEEEN